MFTTLLSVLGYEPELNNCVIDKKKEAEWFSPREGGLVCAMCSRNAKDPLGVKIEKREIETLREILEGDIFKVLKGNEKNQRLGNILENYLLTIAN